MAIVAKNPYKFYLRGVNKDGSLYNEEPKDLEESFNGLRYIRCTGIDEIGKAKNIYTETYSDADKVRTFIPNEIKIYVARHAGVMAISLARNNE